jgi:1-acyl-sn-glycerol-3-phosphate acyltransferase
MGTLAWIAVALGCWVVLVAFANLVVIPRLARPIDDPTIGLIWRFLRIAARVVHRLEVTGLEHLPTTRPPGPLIVVCNHTGSVDPLLVSSQCPFMIRWMMGDDLMWERMAPMWEKLQLIAVDRTGTRSIAIRTALRTLRNKGVIGIFPEGRISLPRGEIRPFFEGVGALIARSKASTLLVWIEGTPETDEVMPSLLGRSHAKVHFIECTPYDGERDARVIADRLRAKLIDASGWKPNDASLPLILPEVLPF